MHRYRIHCKTVIVLALMLATGCLVGCKKKDEAPAPAASSAAPAAAPVAAQTAAESSGASREEQTPQAVKRKIIHNHSLNLQVKELPASLDALAKLADSSGGYVFKSTRFGRWDTGRWGEVGLRVPANRAGGVLAAIRGLGKVAEESSTAEDITEGYVDLEARLKNARASENRLTELYGKAGKVSDVLVIEQELTRVRGDIEAFEAKKKNWDLLTELVTIEIRLDEGDNGIPSFDRVWTPIGASFGKSTVVLADSVQSLIVFIGAVLPWLAVFGPLVYLYVRKVRKSGRKNPLTLKGKTEEANDSGDEVPSSE